MAEAAKQKSSPKVACFQCEINAVVGARRPCFDHRLDIESYNAGIEAAAIFVEGHIASPYEKESLRPVRFDIAQRYRKVNPLRVVYANGVRSLKKGAI